MAIEIDFLKNQPHAIPALASIWYEVLGSIWIPNATIQKAEQDYADHSNSDCLPLTLVAMDNNIPIGMCSLRENDGIRPDLTPWLGSLVIDKDYQGQGIGKTLLGSALNKAKSLGIEKIYLFILNHDLIGYYASLGWDIVGLDVFKGQSVMIMKKDLI
jgi:GNAT superfamily N-acetyltransferase